MIDVNFGWHKELRNFHQLSKTGLTILLYHGVTDSKSYGIENWQGKHISSKKFKEQMQYLKSNCNPISVDRWLEYYNSKEPLPESSVIVSFDDGFRNNWEIAAPILIEFGLPAVFYITSGIVSTELMFWVDVLEDCLNLCEKPYINLKLDKVIKFSIKNDNEKFQALLKIKNWCKKVSSKKKDYVLEQVKEATGIEPSTAHANNYAKITWKQLKEMHDNRLFTIGGHSLYHNILSSLGNKDLEHEIKYSLDLLKVNLGGSIQHYSYPEGQEIHYDKRVISLLKSAGITCSPTAICGINGPHDNPFHLRRIMVGFNGTPFPYIEKTLIS